MKNKILIKRLIGATLMLLTCLGSYAQTQIRITTNVLPPYSPYIQDYPGAGSRVQVFISNLSGKSLSVRLLGKLEGDNGVIIQTSTNYRPRLPLQLNPGDINRLLTRSELEGLFDLGQIDVQGMNKNELYRGLPLPEGNYQLCVQAFDNATIKPLSAEFPMGCSGLIPVKIIEPPILISPYDNEEVVYKTPQNQLFTWSAPVGILPNQLEYTLRIVELPATDVNPNVFIDAVVLPKTGIEVKNLRTTTFLYGPSLPSLQFGKKYAWRVQAHPTSQKLNLMNDGKSPVQIFTYGVQLKGGLLPGVELVNNPMFPFPLLLPDKKPQSTQFLSSDFSKPCECNPIQSNSDNKVDNKKVLQTKKATIANFNLELLAGVTETKGKLNGMGMIPVPMINSGYIKLRVRLIDVQCNEQGEVIGGMVKGLHKDGFPGILPNADQPNAPEVKLGPDDIQKIGDRFAASKDELISSLKNSANSIGFELPWGIDKGVGPMKTVIAITDITFTPKRASFNANTWIETPSSQISGLALSGYNICLSPAKPCGDGILYLAKESKLTQYFSLYGDTDGLAGSSFLAPDTNKVTYVQFDRDGFQKMRIHGLISPPGLLKAENHEPLQISVNADINKGFKDWTAQLSFDKFYIKGLPDFKFSMLPGQPALYDHSELSTPGKLPDGYETEAGIAAWEGLYFPEMSIELPAFVKNEDNTPVTGKIQNLIYDNMGLTGRALLENILSINKGSLGGWYYSIDTFDAQFKNSGFVSSSMNGKVVLPIFDQADPTSHLAYSSTISKNESSGQLNYEMNISPADPSEKMNVPIWNKSKLSLSTSTIKVTYNEAGFEAKANLSGSLDVAAGPITIPAATFSGMVLSSKPDYFSLESFNMSTHSPPKTVADKPFNLNFTKKADGGKPGFTFNCNVDLSEGIGITGEGDLTLTFTTGNNDKGRPDWKFDGFNGTLAAQGDFGAVTTSGTVALFANDPERGDGFEGTFDLSVLDSFKANGKALFGKGPGSNGFSYWYVGGFMEPNPPVGIPFIGPINIKGFGGGFFSNVVQTIGDNGQPTYVPQKGNRGFLASVMVGFATPYLLDAKGTLKMDFDQSGTPSELSIHANAWLLGPDEKSSLATGAMDMDFHFADQKISMHSDLKAGLDLGVGSINASLPADMEIDYSSKPNWYFAMGKPANEGRVTLNVTALGSAFNFGSYFVMGGGGNPITNAWVLPPAPYNFSDELLSLFHRVSGQRKNNLGSNVFNQNNNPFLAFGAGYSFNYDFNLPPFYMHMDGAVGFDMLLKKMDMPCTPGGAIPGINGWYAEGQLYAGLAFSLGLDVDIWVYSGRLEVAKLSAGALLKGGLVNPIWFNGQVAVRYRLLKGLVKGNFNFDFWYNREGQCNPAYLPPNPFADLPLISSIGPSGTDTKTSIITPLVATFNYPVENKMIVEIEIPEGKSVDPNAIGTVSGNTFIQEFNLQFKEKFQLSATKTSGIKVPGANSNEGTLIMGSNATGERNYAATFYRDNALRPNTTYELAVGLQVYAYNPKKGYALEPYLFKNQTVEQTEKVTFVTGNCPVELSKGTSSDDFILTSYPYEGQRYFMKNEQAKPFIKLKSKTNGCLSELGANSQYDLSVAITPLEGNGFAKEGSKSIMMMPAEFDGEKYIYNIPPTLKNNTLYRLQLLKTPKEEFVDEMIAKGYSGQVNTKKITTANIYKSNGTQNAVGNYYANALTGNTPNSAKYASNTVISQVNNKWNNLNNTYTDEKLLQKIGQEANLITATDPSSIKEMNGKNFSLKQVEEVNAQVADFTKKKEKLRKELRQELYRYYFKSSKYNTMKEKIATAQFITATSGSKAPPIKTGDYVSGTMTTDEGFDRYDLNYEELGAGEFRPPLLLLKATENSNWYQKVAKPIADLLSQAPYQYFKSDQDHTKLLDGTLDGFRRSMVQFSTYFTPTDEPYQNIEIFRLFPEELKK